MYNTNQIKQALINTGYFKSNAYLTLYCNLLVKNINNSCIAGKTQKHHTIPACYYSSVKKISLKEGRKEADRDPNNLVVNLRFRDHILAHYYLVRCCSEELFAKLFNALDKQLKGDPNRKRKRTIEEVRQLIEELKLEEYQTLYEQAKSSEFKPVICIETQQVFKSIAEASAWIKIRISKHQLISLSKCVGGYHWAYLEDKEKQKQLQSYIGKPPYTQPNGRGKAVICIETQQVYASSSQVDDTLGYSKGVISEAIRNKRIVRGYHWAYLDDLKSQEELKEFVGKGPETKEDRRKRYLKNRKKPNYTQEYRENVSKRSSKAIICIETQQVYKSLTEAAKNLRNWGATTGGLSSAASGYYETCAGYHWALLEDEQRQEDLKSFIGKPQNSLPSSKKASLKYHLDRLNKGESQIICIETQQTFDTIATATAWAGGSIVGALYSKGYSKGYHWAYLKDTETQEILKEFIGKPQLKERPATIFNQKAIKCVETGEIFNSILEASSAKCCSVSSIINSAQGRVKRPKKFHWVYLA